MVRRAGKEDLENGKDQPEEHAYLEQSNGSLQGREATARSLANAMLFSVA
jgi:hypothetical protein